MELLNNINKTKESRCKTRRCYYSKDSKDNIHCSECVGITLCVDRCKIRNKSDADKCRYINECNSYVNYRRLIKIGRNDV
jgi:hypothetical protein